MKTRRRSSSRSKSSGLKTFVQAARFGALAAIALGLASCAVAALGEPLSDQGRRPPARRRRDRPPAADPRRRHLQMAGRGRLGCACARPAPSSPSSRRPRAATTSTAEIPSRTGRRPRSAGVPRGAYHFVYWCRPAHEQAAWFKRNVPQDPDALPPVLDVEWNGQSVNCPRKVPREQALAMIDVMLREMEAHTGKRPIIYTDITFHKEILEGEFNDYPYWIRSTAAEPHERYNDRRWTFWQFTTTGRVPGIDGRRRPQHLLRHREPVAHVRRRAPAIPATTDASDRGACAATWMPCRRRASTSSPISGSSIRLPACREGAFVLIAPTNCWFGKAPILFPERSGLDKDSNADQNGRTKHAPSRFRIAGRRMEREDDDAAERRQAASTSISARPPTPSARPCATSRRRRSRRGRRRSTAPTCFPRDLWPQMGELGLHGITVEEEYGGDGPRLSRARDRHGGGLPRLRLGRAVLRRPFEPLRQPDPPQRHRGAEAPLPAEADLRRAPRRARHVRAGLGLRRGLHAHPRREARRPLRAQRQQDVDHQRPHRRHPGRLCQDRSGGRARAA